MDISKIKYQEYIGKRFKKYKQKPDKIENKCMSKEPIEFHNTQKFIKDFFKPKNPNKGLYIYHSVGTGKTCTGVIIGANFENDYTILWVTRPSLKDSVWKNILNTKMSCHPAIKNNLQRYTNVNAFTKKRRFNIDTNKKWFKPINYNEFINVLNNSNELGRKLHTENPNDKLKKIILIIDEAHLLFSNMSNIEKQKIIDSINNSYNISGKDSVRVVLMSATPLAGGILDFVDTFNLMLPKKKINYIDIFKNNVNTFRIIGRHISHLDMSKKKSIFAQPDILEEEIIYEEMINNIRELEEDIEEMSCDISYDNFEKLIMKSKEMPIDIMKLILSQMTNEKIDRNQIVDITKYFDRNKICNDEKCLKKILKKYNSNKKKVSKILKKAEKKCKIDLKRMKNKLNKLYRQYNKKDRKQLIDKCLLKDEYMRKTCIEKSKHPFNLFNWIKFNHQDFNPVRMRNYINQGNHMKKIKKLLENIEKFDRKDLNEHNKLFKHAIFVNSSQFKHNGINMLLSAMISNNYEFPYTLEQYTYTFQGQQRIGTRFRYEDRVNVMNNKVIGVLSNNSIAGYSITKPQIKHILDRFNSRGNNGNEHGNLIRFLIFDKNYKEGIDLFDIKYLHIVDPYLPNSTIIQIIGRGTRACGQKGLRFINGTGWKLKVIKYKEPQYDKEMKQFYISEIGENSIKMLNNKIINYSVDKKLKS
jgi:hypothetical protein